MFTKATGASIRGSLKGSTTVRFSKQACSAVESRSMAPAEAVFHPGEKRAQVDATASLIRKIFAIQSDCDEEL